MAAMGPGPAALLRLLRGCTRSHGALMAAALQVVLPLARHPAAGAALVAADAMGVLTEKLQIFRDEKVGVCCAGILSLCPAKLPPGRDSLVCHQRSTSSRCSSSALTAGENSGDSEKFLVRRVYHLL